MAPSSTSLRPTRTPPTAARMTPRNPIPAARSSPSTSRRVRRTGRLQPVGPSEPGATTVRFPVRSIEARVGDVLEVRLTNRLPEPTTIHWHGLRVPAAMDGTDMVQRPIAPGESFTYRFRLPDAGTFWYHPHSNETVQLEKELYGAVIVRGDDEPVLDREPLGRDVLHSEVEESAIEHGNGITPHRRTGPVRSRSTAQSWPTSTMS